MLFQALEQFNILILNIWKTLYIPNYIVSLIVLLILFITIYYCVNTKNIMYVSRSGLQIILESLYFFILDLLKQNIGFKGIKFLPLIFNLFCFIYFINIGGLIGYNLQLTSHIIVTFSLSIMLFLGIIFLGYEVLHKDFYNQFIPKEAPKVLFPLLVVIETVSYIIRPFTLGIRLFANMFSGHVLLYVIISFVIIILEKKLFILKLLIIIFPLILIIFLMSLEFLIMFLQAYVFVLLLCVYLNDSLHAH